MPSSPQATPAADVSKGGNVSVTFSSLEASRLRYAVRDLLQSEAVNLKEAMHFGPPDIAAAQSARTWLAALGGIVDQLGWHDAGTADVTVTANHQALLRVGRVAVDDTIDYLGSDVALDYRKACCRAYLTDRIGALTAALAAAERIDQAQTGSPVAAADPPVLSRVERAAIRNELATVSGLLDDLPLNIRTGDRDETVRLQAKLGELIRVADVVGWKEPENPDALDVRPVQGDAGPIAAVAARLADDLETAHTENGGGEDPSPQDVAAVLGLRKLAHATCQEA